MTRHYEWQRYWLDRAAARASVEGYFADPAEPSWVAETNEARDARQLPELAAEPCLILLGEPGLGKTYSLRQAVESLEASVDAEREIVEMLDLGAYESEGMLVAKLVEGDAWRQWLEGEGTLHLFLDSFDEALLRHRSLHRLLIREFEGAAEALPRLRLRIASRGAEWLPEFSDELGGLFEAAHPGRSGPIPREMVLAQLRRSDVLDAAVAEGFDRWTFRTGLADRGLEGLAAIPLTLRMLLDVAKESGGLPDSRTELFERAALRLVREHNSARGRDPAAGSLAPGQRLAVAERIAAATLFSGHTAIAKESGEPGAGYLDPAQLTGLSEEDPRAAAGAAFSVEVREVVETLRTALFVDASPRAVQFRHRSFAEFLAARYLVRHQLDENQLISLFAVPDDGEELGTRLLEVAAWVAAVHPPVLLELLRREPDLLLRVGRMRLSAEQADSIVDALLAGGGGSVLRRWDRRLWPGLRSLSHPGLAEKLRGPIRDRGAAVEVRDVALMIAHACELPGSEPDLLALALDPDEPAELRAHAIVGLEKFASPETRRALVPLALQPVPGDEKNDVRGAALIATFPGFVDAEAVFSGLGPSGNVLYVGNYAVFLGETLPGAITAAELPVALRWAATVDPRFGRENDYDSGELNLLVDQLLTRAWPLMKGDEEVGRLVAAVIATRLRAGCSPFFGGGSGEGSEDAFGDRDCRRELLTHLVSMVDDDPGAEASIRPSQLEGSRPALLRFSDLDWLLDRLEGSLGTESEAGWAALVEPVCALREPQLERVCGLIERSGELRDRLGDRLEPVALDSELARGLRGQRGPDDGQQEIPADAPYMDWEIEDLLTRFERGEAEAWVRLSYALAFSFRGFAVDAEEPEPDLTRLPGWRRAGAASRARIRAAARGFVEAASPEEGEFGHRPIGQAMLAAYRAFFLLSEGDREELDLLGPESWERWAEVILDWDVEMERERWEAGLAHRVLLRKALAAAPAAFVRWAVRKVELEIEGGEEGVPVLARLDEARNPDLTEALLAKLAAATRPRAVADLLAWTLSRDARRSIELIKPRLENERASGGPRDRETAELAGAVLLRMAPAVGWPIAKRLLGFDRELGLAILRGATEGEGVDVAALGDAHLAELLLALHEALPPGADRDLDPESRATSPREQRRKRMVLAFAERGGEEALEAISVLNERYPDHYSYEREMVEDTLRVKGEKIEAEHVIRLCCGNDARLVFSAGDLHQAVVSSLRRIGRSLQEGEPPSAPELWDTDAAKPKSEDRISDWLSLRLREDLKAGGRVVNREVQVEASKSGKGRGTSTDVQVSAPIGKFYEGAENAKVIIEVKGCWNRGVKSAMEGQLVDRYLVRSGTGHGVYVVLWFSPEDWSSSDYRRRQWGKDLASTRELFEAQAAKLSESAEVTVSAVVFDGSL